MAIQFIMIMAWIQPIFSKYTCQLIDLPKSKISRLSNIPDVYNPASDPVSLSIQQPNAADVWSETGEFQLGLFTDTNFEIPLFCMSTAVHNTEGNNPLQKSSSSTYLQIARILLKNLIDVVKTFQHIKKKNHQTQLRSKLHSESTFFLLTEHCVVCKGHPFTHY